MMRKSVLFIFILVVFIFIAGCSSSNNEVVDDTLNKEEINNQPDYEVVVEEKDVQVDDGLGSITGNAVVDSVGSNDESYLDEGINVIDNRPILDPKVQKLVDSARKVTKYS